MYLKPPPFSRQLTVGSSPNHRHNTDIRQVVSSTYASSTHPLIQTYSIAGRLISVTADNRKASELFDYQLSGWYFKHVDHGGKLDATIHVCDGSPPAVPDNLDSFELPAGGRCYTDGTALHIVYDDSLVTVGYREPSLVKAWTGYSASSRTAAARSRLVSNAVAAAVRRCGLYGLHGACVIEPASRKGVLFAGPSGSAKSTLAAQLANNGWGYLSDDSLLLYQENEISRVHALRRAFSVTRETVWAGGVGRFTSVLNRRALLDPSKQMFDPGDVVPDAFAESTAPSVIVFPNVSDRSRTQAQPLSRQAAMSSLIRLCPWASFDRIAAPGYLQALSHLVRSCAAYRLDVGADLFGDAAATARFISALL
jgi:hypothetical protein